MSSVHRNENPSRASVLKAHPAVLIRKYSPITADLLNGGPLRLFKQGIAHRPIENLFQIVFKPDDSKRVIKPNVVLIFL